jgi:hypothetical protein
MAGAPPGFEATREAAARHWRRFWSTGGAVDLSGSRDPRWKELERRVVLSQYLTAIQCSGGLPPQETGLTCNSWEGKFHLEMHLWHAAHFALWDRLPLLERSLGYYQSILGQRAGDGAAPGLRRGALAQDDRPVGPRIALARRPLLDLGGAASDFLRGAVPPRASGPRHAGESTPKSSRRRRNSWPATPRGKATAPAATSARRCNVRRRFSPRTTCSIPTFELTYWRWGLETAQQWRLRVWACRANPPGTASCNIWPSPALEDGKYLFAETATGTYTENKWTHDHPSVTAALGLLPGPGIDPPTMRRTLDWIWDHWDWPRTWGWDYPMLAMCAARAGEPARAVDALFLDTPKNHYALNGHNYQRPGLTLYLPGNGSLLYAVAMMAAGWDGAPAGPAPGFPSDGQWTVRWENLRRAP